MLVNYTNKPQDGLKSCVFGYDFKTNEVEDKLVHLVLRNVVLGCLFFSRIACSLVQTGVIYEEEDVNTQVMGLNILSGITVDEVIESLNSTEEFLNENFPKEKDSIIINSIVYILKSLVQLPLFLNTRIPVKSENVRYDFSFLDKSLENVDNLQNNLSYLNSIDKIKGCYSLGIQKRLDNTSPPRFLQSYDLEDYSSIVLLFNDFKQIFTITERQLPKDIISHSLNFANTDHHSIARAYYPLMLIRNDRTILGDESLTDFLNDLLTEFSCFNSDLLSNENNLAKNKISEFMNQLSVQFFEVLSVMNQNPCRQRQFLSRLIIQFDSLQANAENLEVTLSDVFQFNDEFREDLEQEKLSLAIPLTSWIYFYKLDIMISVVLRGFQLDLYKTWEFHSMYWYASYLIDNILSLLDRVIKYNLYKIETIKNMNKKLKKKKGEQKLKYKEKYEYKVREEIPRIEQIINNLNSKIQTYKIIQNLCELQMINLSRLVENHIIKTPDFPFAQNIEMLYKLRMKPYSSVGIPHFPNYNQYINDLEKSYKLNKNEDRIRTLRNQILQDSKQIIDVIENQEYSDYTINKDSWVGWFKLYQKSCIGIGLNVYKNQDPSTVKVAIESEGYHRYFPIVKLLSK